MSIYKGYLPGLYLQHYRILRGFGRDFREPSLLRAAASAQEGQRSPSYRHDGQLPMYANPIEHQGHFVHVLPRACGRGHALWHPCIDTSYVLCTLYMCTRYLCAMYYLYPLCCMSLAAGPWQRRWVRLPLQLQCPGLTAGTGTGTMSRSVAQQVFGGTTGWRAVGYWATGLLGCWAGGLATNDGRDGASPEPEPEMR